MLLKNIVIFSGFLIFILGCLLLIFAANWIDKYEKKCPQINLPKHFKVYSFVLGLFITLYGIFLFIFGLAHHYGHL